MRMSNRKNSGHWRIWRGPPHEEASGRRSSFRPVPRGGHRTCGGVHGHGSGRGRSPRQGRHLRRHGRAEQLLRLGRPGAVVAAGRPRPGPVQRPLPGDRFPGTGPGRAQQVVDPQLHPAERGGQRCRHPAGIQDRVRDDDGHRRLAVPTHPHLRPDRELLRHQGPRARHRPPDPGQGDHRRLRLLEAHLAAPSTGSPTGSRRAPGPGRTRSATPPPARPSAARRGPR